jgi:hypothetical protein
MAIIAISFSLGANFNGNVPFPYMRRYPDTEKIPGDGK